MTVRDALKGQYVAGFVLRRACRPAEGFYLTGPAESARSHSTQLIDALFFLTLREANETARLLRHVTGYRYEVETVGTTVPGPAPRCCKGERLREPCRVEVAAEGEYHWPEDERPLLTAADALNAAAEHFLEDQGDDELSGLAVDAVRTEWGTFHIGPVS